MYDGSHLGDLTIALAVHHLPERIPVDRDLEGQNILCQRMTAQPAGLDSSPPADLTSHFAVASPFAGAVAHCRQSDQAWLISKTLADALDVNGRPGRRIILHFCEAAAFVAWGYMQSLQDKCLLRVAWQQTATLPISLSHAQNLMQQPALSEKAGQILLRLFAQAGDLEDVGEQQGHHHVIGNIAQSGLQDPRRKTQEAAPMQAAIMWQLPVRLAPGKAVAAMGEDSSDVVEEAQRESAIPVLQDDFCNQVILITCYPHVGCESIATSINRIFKGT